MHQLIVLMRTAFLMRPLTNETCAKTVVPQSIYSTSRPVLPGQKQPPGKPGLKHHVTTHERRQNTILEAERLDLLVEMRQLATGAHGGPGFRLIELSIAKHSC